MKKKVLIIGANGFTGRHMLNDFSANTDYLINGCSLHNDIAPNSGNYRFLQTDICCPKDLDLLFQEIQPDVVINTSALSVPDYCETHREEALQTNVEAVAAIAHRCQQIHARFIHLSTDFVFNGQANRLYTEEDTPDPVNYYGVTKWKGEQKVAELCDNYAIVRVVVVYGVALPGQHGNILQLVANRLRNHEEIRVVSDQWRTPTYIGDISQGVKSLITHPQNGIYHLCGKDCLSIAEIAYRVADMLQLDRSLIIPVTTQEMHEATPRPQHSGLSIEKACKDINYQPHTLDEGIRLMFNLE